VKVRLEDLVKREGKLSKRQLSLVRSWLEADWEAADVDKNVLKLIRRLVATASHIPAR